jgi:hypothetical protein
VYRLDTLQENSLLMATNRNRLPSYGTSVLEGSNEQVGRSLRFGVVGSDERSCGSGCGSAAAVPRTWRGSTTAVPGTGRGSAATVPRPAGVTALFSAPS